MNENDRPATIADLRDTRQQMAADLQDTRQQMAADLRDTRQQMAADLRDTRQQTAADLQAARQQMAADLEAAEQRIIDQLTETMRTMQTELLRGFASFSEGMNIRLRKVESNQATLDESTTGRLRIIEERMLQIEIRLGLQ